MEASTPLEIRERIFIRWRDLDMLGHLNQAVYHELLEEGRAALFAHFAPMGDFAFVLARVELDYRSEVRRDHEHVDVVVRVERVGGSSITVAHEVELPDGTIAAEGRSVLVAWDPAARGSRKLGEEERAALQGVVATGR